MTMRLCRYDNSIGRKCDFWNCMEFANFLAMNDLFVSYYCDEHKPSINRIENETEIKSDHSRMNLFHDKSRADFNKKLENTFRNSYKALKKGEKLKLRILVAKEKIYTEHNADCFHGLQQNQYQEKKLLK